MPSYEAAAEERPVTDSGEQPRRQLAKRKNAPGAGETPAIKPAGKPAERIGPHCPKCATLTRERDGQWWCKWCELAVPQDPAAETTPKPAAAAEVSPEGRTVSPKPPSVAQKAPEVSPATSPFAAGRRGPKLASVLGAGLGEKEAKRLQKELSGPQTTEPDSEVPQLLRDAMPETVPCRKCPGLCRPRMSSHPIAKNEVMFICAYCGSCAAIWAGELTAPGLNGDHATRAQERAKIPPSRPANNSRGDEGMRKVGEFTFYRGEPPPRRFGAATTPLGQAIRALQPGEFMTIPPDEKTYGFVRTCLHNLRNKNLCPGLQTYLSADRSVRVVMRKADAGQGSEAAR